MFKSNEQIAVYIDQLEKFVKAVIVNHSSEHVEDAVYLNKQRDTFEKFLIAASGGTLASDTVDTYLCPECGKDMAKRTNRQNGNQFWGCKKYPDCKGTRDENGLSKAEREEAKHIAENMKQESGYSFNKKRDPVTETGP